MLYRGTKALYPSFDRHLPSVDLLAFLPSFHDHLAFCTIHTLFHPVNIQNLNSVSITKAYRSWETSNSTYVIMLFSSLFTKAKRLETSLPFKGIILGFSICWASSLSHDSNYWRPQVSLTTSLKHPSTNIPPPQRPTSSDKHRQHTVSLKADQRSLTSLTLGSERQWKQTTVLGIASFSAFTLWLTWHAIPGDSPGRDAGSGLSSTRIQIHKHMRYSTLYVSYSSKFCLLPNFVFFRQSCIERPRTTRCLKNPPLRRPWSEGCCFVCRHQKWSIPFRGMNNIR
jgi:hypothetical protein